MGIRFACHVCERKLNIKGDLAGRRGICPACSSRFRIPLEDSEKSIPVDDESSSKVVATQPPPTKESTAIASPTRAKSPPTTILDDDNDGTWYVRPPSGGQYGPATTELLKQWIGEGRVAATSLIWRDGWPQWRDASEALPELIAKLPQTESFKGSPSPSLPLSPPVPFGAKRSAPAGVPVPPTGPERGQSPGLSGNANVGANRRKQSVRRVYLIGVLTALVAALVAGLIFVVNR